MKIREFLTDRWGKLLLHLIAAVSLSVFLMLTGTSPDVLIIVLLVWGSGLLAVLVIEYSRKRAYLKTLEAILEGLDKKYLFVECMPKPKQYYDKKIFKMLKRSAKAMIEAVSEAEVQQKEYQEFIENWVHEIKVPITTMQLIGRNHKSETTNKMMLQTRQIEEEVERVLYYARAGSVEKDFIIRAVDLSDIIRQVIGKYQLLLIQNSVRIEVENLEEEVYTDGKWAAFMIGQLLSNAVRYKGENPLIQVEAKRLGGAVRLSITDNGMGIPAHEAGRIFDRGFTGTNGRKRGGSTGMGLYICKHLSEFLHIDLSAESIENEYTKVSIVFPAKEKLTKM